MGMWWEGIFFSSNAEALEGVRCISREVEYRAIEPESFELQYLLSILYKVVTIMHHY